MKRLITILLLVFATSIYADYRITVKVEKTTADTTEAKLKIHHAKKDSVQPEIRAILDNLDIEGWMIVDNDEGTQYVATAPDTLPVVGMIRSALQKYNERVTVKKEQID